MKCSFPELAARKNVDMERAKSDLEEHQLSCVSARKLRHSAQSKQGNLLMTSESLAKSVLFKCGRCIGLITISEASIPLTLWKGPDIPILKERKAKYPELQ